MANGPSYARWSLEPYSIGMKLRTLRTQKHLTLSRLAAETGLSTALLSKLETDRMIPTLPTLANICRVYGVGLSHFFSDATKHTLGSWNTLPVRRVFCRKWVDLNAAWFTCWKERCIWTQAACTRCSRAETASTSTATWPWRGAPETKAAVGRW